MGNKAMILFQSAEWLASFAEAIIGILSTSAVLGEEKPRWRQDLAASAVLAGIIWLVNQYRLFSIAATIAGILGIAVSVSVIYKKKLSDTLIIAACYLLLLYITDFLSISILSLITRKGHFARTVTSSFSEMRLVQLLLSKVFIISVYMIFAKKIHIRFGIPRRKLTAALILESVLMYLVVKEMLGASMDLKWVIICFHMLLVILCGVYISHSYALYAQEKEHWILEQEKLCLESEFYKEEACAYKKRQCFFHDLDNHYIVIQGYMKSKRYKEAEEYMEHLEQSKPMPVKPWTGNTSIDALLYYKKSEAENAQIYMDMKADQICLRLTEQEIIGMFGNLLDNAIEACKRVDFRKRWIRFSVHRIQGMTFMKIINSCEEVPADSEGIFKTGKENPNLHGLGLQSIRGCCESLLNIQPSFC